MDDRERDQDRAESEEPQLKVTDRRLFAADGQLRDGVDVEAEAEAESPDAGPEPTTGDSRPEEPREEPAAESVPETGFQRQPLDEPEGVDFTMLINAMAQPALLFLGEIPHPGTGAAQVDLEQARLQIDMLQLLRVKCRGNISREEESLLDRILYQLRMLYVERSSQP